MKFRSLSLILIASLSARFALAQSNQSTTQLGEVVITASPLGGTLFEQAQPVNVLTGERLRFRSEPTIGETINHEPGVSSSGFAPGASRPVIRGLADDRVRTLQNGVATQDISNVSPDHAITISAFHRNSGSGARAGDAALCEGAIGFQTQSIDFSAIGAEAFLPQVDTHVNAVFVFEEATISERWRLQFGGRYDRQTNDSDSAPGFVGAGARVRCLQRLGGLVFTPVEEWAIALTASYTQRPPTYVELFANGPHVATHGFEIGDPDLGLEESVALDLSVRRKLGRVAGAASVFYYHFTDFITSTPTGLFAEEAEGEEGLPVFVSRAKEANFFGGEVELTFHFIEPRPAKLRGG